MEKDDQDCDTRSKELRVARFPPLVNLAWERNGASEPMANHVRVAESREHRIDRQPNQGARLAVVVSLIHH